MLEEKHNNEIELGKRHSERPRVRSVDLSVLFYGYSNQYFIKKIYTEFRDKTNRRRNGDGVAAATVWRRGI